MARGIGGVDVIQGLVPDVAALVAAALAQLGSAWFLSVLLVVLYWTRPGEEHDVLLVGSLLLVAFGIYRTLKELFALPRPAELLLAPADAPALIRPLYDAAVLGTGYGFPSGHATNNAVVYIGLAAVLGIWTRRRRYATATALVTVVALTRILLGVHYLVDVIAGASLGASVAVLGVYGVRQFVDDGVTVTLVLGVFASAGYVVASEHSGHQGNRDSIVDELPNAVDAQQRDARPERRPGDHVDEVVDAEQDPCECDDSHEIGRASCRERVCLYV